MQFHVKKTEIHNQETCSKETLKKDFHTKGNDTREKLQELKEEQ